MTYYDQNNSGSSLGDRMWSAAKRRPEAVLFFAAACALLASGRSKRVVDWSRDTGRQAWESGSSAFDGVGDRLQSLSDQTSDYVRGVADQARGMRSTLSDTASNYADTASRYAASMRDTVSSQAGDTYDRVVGSAQSNLEYLLNEQPIALGLIGLAAGAALGAALPATDVENRTFGAQRDQLARLAQQAASDKVEELKSHAGQVSERVVNAVQENGLSADGLKRAVADVAETLSGDQGSSGEADRSNGSKNKGASSRT